MKVACTVWSGGKSGDNFKGLPIAIWREIAGNETTYGRRRSCPDWDAAYPSAGKPVRLRRDSLC
ncbi:hypothetical protein EF_2325 [Enterococcus faecalis V583]|uniref:Uncharacterized protein n=1 Tax=Enterococcus faecalis (strain ATCC 700802 / V583) TaxID=226185 RepID=Q832B5_ENTFA|nr:hypothetical protein EF_2325 [Enterococcus faecalis V583]